MVQALKKNILNKLKFNLETALMIIMITGLACLNKTFAYNGFKNIYISEFLLLIILLIIGVSLITKYKYIEEFRALSKTLIISSLLIIFAGIVRLILDKDYGLLAYRQSFITFYTSFIFCFYFTINTKKKLINLLHYLIIIPGIFIGIKILIYLMMGLEFNAFEPMRVYHNEVDVICVSFSLMGLIIFRKQLLSKSKIVYFVTMALCVLVLVATVKRTALMALIILLPILILLDPDKIPKKTLKRALLIVLICSMGAVIGLIILDFNKFKEIIDFVILKLSFTKEENSSWRLKAWDIAIEKFMEKPITGSGFGKEILDVPLDLTPTIDPHNSFIAYLVYNGILGFIPFVYIVFLSIKTYIVNIKKAVDPIHRKASVLLFLFLLYMMNFCFFNVVLENQYQGIFFWFSISGAFIINNLYNNKNTAVEKKSIIRTIINAVFGIILIVYIVFIISPINNINYLSIYSSVRRGQLPLINNPNEGEGIKMDVDSSGLIMTLNEDYIDNSIEWMLLDDCKLVENYYDYLLVIDYEKFIDKDNLIYTFMKENGEGIYLRNYDPGKNKTIIPLREVEANGIMWRETSILGIIPASKINQPQLKITGVGIEYNPDYFRKYEFFNHQDGGEVPYFNIYDASSVDLELDKNGYIYGLGKYKDYVYLSWSIYSHFQKVITSDSFEDYKVEVLFTKKAVSGSIAFMTPDNTAYEQEMTIKGNKLELDLKDLGKAYSNFSKDLDKLSDVTLTLNVDNMDLKNSIKKFHIIPTR